MSRRDALHEQLKLSVASSYDPVSGFDLSKIDEIKEISKKIK